MTYATRFVSQRKGETGPLIDCAWASLSMWIDKGCAGKLPLIDKDVLRAKSGDTEGGSSIFDMARGVNRIYPSMVMDRPIRSWNQVEELGASGYGFVVLIDHGKWPAHLRRFSPGFTGTHWIYMETLSSGMWRLLNPLGFGPSGNPYRGEPASNTDMERAAAGFLDSISPVLEGSLMSTTTDREVFPQRKFTINPGRVTGYAFNSTTGRYETGKSVTIAAPTTSIVADARGLIEQYPVKGKAPSGAHVRIANGAFAGQWIPEASGTLETLPVPEPIDCGALVTAAVTPLQERLDAIDVLASPVPA